MFLGIGTSGTLGKYGARYFSNVGYYSQSIDDPYYPPPVDGNESSLLIALTESGETREVIDQLKMYQSQNTKIVVITNKPGSTIDQMADLGIYYYVKDIIYHKHIIFHLKFLFFIFLSVLLMSYKMLRKIAAVEVYQP
ncbi:MAG: SIS domain-containing protein [Thomasclavelia ramosa]